MCCFLTTIWYFNSLNAELNPICHLLALIGAHHILHVSWISVKHDVLYAFLALRTVVTKFSCTSVLCLTYGLDFGKTTVE